jgi:hypothetical protein
MADPAPDSAPPQPAVSDGDLTAFAGFLRNLANLQRPHREGIAAALDLAVERMGMWVAERAQVAQRVAAAEQAAGKAVREADVAVLEKRAAVCVVLLSQETTVRDKERLEGTLSSARFALRDIAALPLPTDALDREIKAARADERRKVAEGAAQIAETSIRAEAPLCPYGRDKPGDPTWDHTDNDICPVCRKSGHESLTTCTDSVGGNIASAIRALAAQAGPGEAREDG